MEKKFPVQEYADGEHRNFRCACGKSKFEHLHSWIPYDYDFKCDCGRIYNFAYGSVFGKEGDVE